MMRKIPLAGALSLAAALLLASCMNDSGDSKPPAPSGGESSGTFTVTLKDSTEGTQGHSTLVGQVFAGVNPSVIDWQKTDAAGACTLFVPKDQPNCEGGCGSDSLCVSDGVCKAFVKSVSVGKVAVSGIRTTGGDAGFSMDPLVTTRQVTYQPPAGTILALPPTPEGGTATLTAAGDTEVGPFSVSAKGIAPLKLQNDSVSLEAGKSIELKWTPAAQPSASTVSATVDISHHGGSKGKIDCSTSDAGSLTIDGTLLKKLRDLGVAGFPKIDIARRSVGANAEVGVDLVLTSPVTLDLHIPGVISCNDPSECPGGQTCTGELICK